MQRDSFFRCLRGVSLLLLIGLTPQGAQAYLNREALFNFSVELGRDPDGMLGIEDILQMENGSFFEESGHPVPSFGFTSDAIWMRSRMVNVGQEPLTFFTTLQVARLRTVDWYWVIDNQIVQSRSEGLDRPPFPVNRMRFPTFLAVLPEQGQGDLYLRVTSDHSIFLPLRAVPLIEALQENALRNQADSLFFGFGLGMLIFTVLLAFAYPRRGFTQLVGILFFYLIYYAVFHGYLAWFFPGFPLWWNRNFLLICVGMSFTQQLSFARTFYRERPLPAWVDKGLPFLIRISFIWLGVMVFLPFSRIVQVNALHNSLVYVFLLVMSFQQFLKNRSWGDFYYFFSFLLIFIPLTLFWMQIHLHIFQSIHPVWAIRLIAPMIGLLCLAANLERHNALSLERENLLHAKQEATRASLESLRYQLNPHFLFNTLNSIVSLSRISPEKVPSLVGKLAVFLRLRLKPSEDGMVFLKEEMQICRSYLDIEKIRFMDCLQVKLDIQTECETILIPEMILQPLVENALKYGFEHREILELEMVARMKEDQLEITIRNTGSLPETSSTPHLYKTYKSIGIENLCRRLELIYGEDADFSLFAADDWVNAVLNIPVR
jgi:hypothetical protein